MAAQDIQKHFKKLRVDRPARRRPTNPFSEEFSDQSDGEKDAAKSTIPEKHAPPATKVSRRSIASPFASIAFLDDSDSDPSAQRTDRRPSPAPTKIDTSHASDRAAKRSSLDKDHGRAQTSPNSIASPFASIAFLADSASDDEVPNLSPKREDRRPSPAPPLRRRSEAADAPVKVVKVEKEPTQFPRLPRTVASPFAGTKYLDDSESDSDEEAISDSRHGSTDSTRPQIGEEVEDPGPLESLNPLQVKRVDKPRPEGSGVSWRAFSESRTAEKTAELEALQSQLRTRGKSISFSTHAVTDDGKHLPIAPKSELRGRRRSPPRRPEEAATIYDPEEFKTNPFTGEPVRRSGKRISESPSWSVLNSQETPETKSDQQSASLASLTSESTMSPTSDEPPTPIDSSVDLVLSPKSIDPTFPTLSPTSDIPPQSPLSRNSSARSVRIPGPRTAGLRTTSRRSSRRSTSTSTSASPAHAFLNSWSRGSETTLVPEPKPDDEGQAIGLNNELIIGRELGRGGFSVVKEVHSIKDGQDIVRAVKIVRKTLPDKQEAENEQCQQELEHEVSVWRYLKHRHILPLHTVYDTDFATFCVMDLNVGGTLFELVQKSRRNASTTGRKMIDAKLAKRYACQLASALRYLHEDMRVCHRDVKLENCLIDMLAPDAETEGGNLRLCDFGLADFLHSESIDMPNSDEEPPQIGHRPTPSMVIGTLEYASPKGLSVSRKLFETAGDVWAFGVIVYALCTGQLPFRHPMPSMTVEMILRAEWDNQALLQAGGEDVIDLVKGCLEKDISTRLSIGEALSSGWFDGCRDESSETELEGWQ